MRVRKGCGIACLLGLAGAAFGQSAVNVHEVDQFSYDGDLATAPTSAWRTTTRSSSTRTG